MVDLFYLPLDRLAGADTCDAAVEAHLIIFTNN
jgi:hypothetical protein